MRPDVLFKSIPTFSSFPSFRLQEEEIFGTPQEIDFPEICENGLVSGAYIAI